MALGGACPGRCNAQYRKAREAFEQAIALYDPLDSTQERPIPPDIQSWPGDPIWCGRCRSTIRQQLDELDYAGCVMAAAADGLRGESGEQRVSGTQEQPSPSPANDDLEELFGVLTGWEDSYRELMGWRSAHRRGYLAQVVTTTTDWLIAHLDGILAREEIAVDFGTEVMQWHREITGKGKEGARRLRKPMRCPGCGLLTLSWVEGERYVKCSNPACGRLLSLQDYENEVAVKAGQAARQHPAA